MVRNLLWWSGYAASAILSIFFLFVGISLCIASYDLEHPHQFILTFFASNFIILISLVVLIAVVVRIISHLRHSDPQPVVESPEPAPDSSQLTNHEDLQTSSESDL